MTKELDLSDSQYMDILLKIQDTLSNPNFKVSCYDSTTLGDKYTESNCGLCNDRYTTKDTAMFPEQFPERNSMKYIGDKQKCPFDIRKTCDSYGCFYHCYLFRNKTHDLKLMRAMVKAEIAKRSE